MKHTSIISAALLAALSLSCAKQQPADINILPEGSVKAVFTAQSDGLKATLDGTTVSWENGDQIRVYQYGNYKYNTPRHSPKDDENIFTTTGSAQFSGTIAGYELQDPSEDIPEDKKNSRPERFYAVYPAASCSGCGVSTAKYKITVPAEQTGLLSDFKKSAIFVGSLDAADGDVTSYDEGTKTLTFLKPFDMFCVTPVLKFNVPASLNVTGIKITGTDADGNAVGLASAKGYYVRSDANGVIKKDPADDSKTNLPEITEITISRGGAVISGDIYAIIAPSADAKDKGESYAYHLCTAKTLSFELTTSDGKSATLDLPITGDIKGTAIKKLPDFPAEIEWKLPAGPGLKAISTDGEIKTKSSKIIIEAENANSTVHYRNSRDGFDALSKLEFSEYDSENCIEIEKLNYTEYKVTTEGFSDYKAKAITWILNNWAFFGKDFADYTFASDPVVGTTFPEDGSFLYGLKFTYTALGGGDGPLTKPQINSFLLALMANTSYCQGSLSIQVPESGRAKLFVHSNQSSNRAVNIMKNNEETAIASFTAAKCEGEIKTTLNSTDFVNVKAGDVITIAVAKINIISLTLLLEPVEATAEAINEQLDGTTPYNL